MAQIYSRDWQHWFRNVCLMAKDKILYCVCAIGLLSFVSVELAMGLLKCHPTSGGERSTWKTIGIVQLNCGTTWSAFGLSLLRFLSVRGLIFPRCATYEY